MNVKIGSPLKRRFCSLLLGLAMLAGHGRMVQAASPPGDVVGKVTVGYQGWFATNGDGSPLNNWWHWSPNAAQAPSPSNNDIPIWPDMREYTTVFQSGFANLGNGKSATLFSNYTDQTVNTQFRWMQQNGIDTAALQRFNPTGYEGPIRNAISTKVKNAAQTTGRKFYIMYDISGWTNLNNQYVCAEGGGNQTVVANRASVGIWETFGIIDTNAGDIQNNDIIHLRAYNGSFLCADNAGGGTLFADRAIPGGWEEFTVIKTSGSGVIANGNTVAFRSQGGKYLTVVSSGGAVNVTGTSIGTAQTFTVNYVS